MKKVIFLALLLLSSWQVSVAVTPSVDVYVAGYNGNFAKLWINGIPQYLTDGTYCARANCVFVSGNDVYVAGYEENSQGKLVATLWKNGNGQRLTNGKEWAEANSVFVSGNDVYVAGNKRYEDGGDYGPVLWKNAVAQNLTDDGWGSAGAYSVFVVPRK